MICPNCGKEHIQIISEYIELDKKEPAPALDTIKTWYVLGIILSCILFIFAFILSRACKSTELSDMVIPGILCILAGWLMVVSVSKLNKVKTILAFQPFLHQTNTKAVCLECGHTWYLEKDVK